METIKYQRKLKRNLDGLLKKCLKYGDIQGVELALYVAYPDQKGFVSYESKPELSWIHDIESKVRVVLVAPSGHD